VNMLANFVTEFTFDRFVVFRGTINTKQQKPASDEGPKTI
jgi:hypothetical protein